MAMHVGKGIYLGLICKQVTAGAVVGLTCKAVGMKCCGARTFKAVGWGASRTVLVTNQHHGDVHGMCYGSCRPFDKTVTVQSQRLLKS